MNRAGHNRSRKSVGASRPVRAAVARGERKVRGPGGITIAQDNRSSTYTPMPSNAVSSGCVDIVATPAKIARELVELSRRTPFDHSRGGGGKRQVQGGGRGGPWKIS